MNYRYCWIRRAGMILVVATAGCLSASSTEAGEHGGLMGDWQPRGPIFKTLDTVAGGIESVLQRTVLARRPGAHCDAINCDDSCDAVTLQQLQHRSLHQPAPRVESTPRPVPRVPADHPSRPSVLSSEDGWIDSFNPSQPISRNAQPQRVGPRSQQHYDALPNPFLDDPRDN